MYSHFLNVIFYFLRKFNTGRGHIWNSPLKKLLATFLKPPVTTSQVIERTHKISQGVKGVNTVQQQKESTGKHLGPNRFPCTATQATVLVSQDTFCLRCMNHEDTCKKSWFQESLSNIFQGDHLCPIGYIAKREFVTD